MIVIRVWGGIGNQLFQYAFGEYLRLIEGKDVKYDINSFGTSDCLRRYELPILNNNIPTIHNCHFSKYTGLLYCLYLYLYRLNTKNLFFTDRNFDISLLEENKINYLQGYWLDMKYVELLKKKAPDLFLPKREMPIMIKDVYDKIHESSNPISIHIRRGDYYSTKNVKILGVCTNKYFEESLRILEQTEKLFQLFVFSDDLDWVKENIRLPKDSYFVSNEDVDQFWYIYLMSNCNHNIISNSTFSWWGAMLNKNENKKIIIPKCWINGPGHEKYYKIYGTNWIKI